MQLFDHVLRSKTTPPPNSHPTAPLQGDNAENWIAYFKLKPTRDVTLPVLLLLHLCLGDGCKVLESLEQDEGGRRPTKAKKKKKKVTARRRGGGVRTGLIRGRFNMETEGFINRAGGAGPTVWGVPGKQNDNTNFCPTVSEKQIRSQSVQGYSPPVAWPSRGRFLPSCLFRPRGLGSPRHPALVAVRRRGASESPEAHAHPHANALG